MDSSLWLPVGPEDALPRRGTFSFSRNKECVGDVCDVCDGREDGGTSVGGDA